MHRFEGHFCRQCSFTTQPAAFNFCWKSDPTLVICFSDSLFPLVAYVYIYLDLFTLIQSAPRGAENNRYGTITKNKWME